MNEKLNPKEPYEAPAVLDISPVTINVAEGVTNGEPESPDATP